MRLITLASTLCVFHIAGTAFAADAKVPTTQPVTTKPASQPATKPSNRVVIDTNKGKIVVELTPDKTPITVKNFLTYVDEKYYDGTIFHRVMKGFMIQGGGFTADLEEKKKKAPIKNESKNALSNKRGTIAMARMDHPDSASSEFYINHVDNDNLDTFGGGYCVFGKVVEGMDVVDQIAATPTKRQPPLFAALPVDVVKINSIKRK